MLPSGLPNLVADKEDLARFLTQSNHFKVAIARPAAFLPNPRDRETSVSRHGQEPAERLWRLAIPLIKTRIAEKPEDFLRELFGGGIHSAGSQSWRAGTKESLAISIKDDELWFFDAERNEGGDCIALWQRERGVDSKQAFEACAKWARIYCVVILKAQAAREKAKLTVESDEPPDFHAAIRGWPWIENDPDKQRAQQKELANKLCDAAGSPMFLSDR